MQSLRRWKDNRIVRLIVMAFLVLAAAVSVIRGAGNALEFSQDFQWDAAMALRKGIDPYEMSLSARIHESEVPELAEFYRMFTDRGLKQKMEANQFPSLLALLFPMTYFAPVTARYLWLALNLAFTFGIVVLLRKTFFENADVYEFAAVMLLMLAGTPYRNQIGVGQHTLFAFFFFMLAVYLEKKMSPESPAGSIFIGLCLFVSYFKYTLSAPLALYFIYKKRYKELVLSVAGHIVMTGVFAVKLGKSFIYMIKAPLDVASNLAAEGGIDLGVLLGSPLCYAVAFVIAVFLMVLVVKLPQKNDNLLFSLLILWSLILTYHRTYDFFVMSAAAAMFCKDEQTADGSIFTGGFWTYAVLMVSVFFGLRAFNENTVSKICVGVMYYIFTVVLTYTACKRVNFPRGWKDNNEKE